jgi:hypothetical protein
MGTPSRWNRRTRCISRLSRRWWRCCRPHIRKSETTTVLPHSVHRNGVRSPFLSTFAMNSASAPALRLKWNPTAARWSATALDQAIDSEPGEHSDHLLRTSVRFTRLKELEDSSSARRLSREPRAAPSCSTCVRSSGWTAAGEPLVEARRLRGASTRWIRREAWSSYKFSECTQAEAATRTRPGGESSAVWR